LIGANNDPDTFFDNIFDFQARLPPAGAQSRPYYRQSDNRMRCSGLICAAQEVRAIGNKREREFVQQGPENHRGGLAVRQSVVHSDNVSVHRKRISDVQLSPTGAMIFLRSIEAR